jgi:hypothetical protein
MISTLKVPKIVEEISASTTIETIEPTEVTATPSVEQSQQTTASFEVTTTTTESPNLPPSIFFAQHVSKSKSGEN